VLSRYKKINFEQYINIFELIMQEMTTSQKYKINYKFYPATKDISEFEEIISGEHNLNGFRGIHLNIFIR
jgi:hypothetical protein